MASPINVPLMQFQDAANVALRHLTTPAAFALLDAVYKNARGPTLSSELAECRILAKHCAEIAAAEPSLSAQLVVDRAAGLLWSDELGA